MKSNKELGENDYIVYDKKNDKILKFAIGRKYIIYNDKKEAEEDCLLVNKNYGGVYKVVRCLDLPRFLQFAILCNIDK